MNNPRITIIKEPDDPNGMHAHISGSKENGYDLRYRGDRVRVLRMLKSVIKEFDAQIQREEVRE